MSKRTGNRHISIQGIEVEIEKKKIKNMYLRILPPEGRVYITAPIRMPEHTIREFVESKKDWIKLQQEKQQIRIEKEKQRNEQEYKTGESVLLWGKVITLEVQYKAEHNTVERYGEQLLLKVRETKELSTSNQREKILKNWLRNTLSQELPNLFHKWETIIGVKANDWYIRDMKTRWGTCNVRTKRICINLRLINKDPDCLEYVVVHELVHLLEKSHNHIFKAYMDQFYPLWKEVKARLNI